MINEFVDWSPRLSRLVAANDGPYKIAKMLEHGAEHLLSTDEHAQP